jgi:hypothetical protein
LKEETKESDKNVILLIGDESGCANLNIDVKLLDDSVKEENSVYI